MRWLGVCLGAAVGLSSACDPAALTLVVQLKSDWVAGVEVATIETRVLPIDETGDALDEAETEAAGLDLLAGARIAELDDLPPGSYDVVVDLRGPDGEVFDTHRMRVDLRTTTAVTALMTRNCAGVSCPGLTQCVSMRCVDPACTPETPERCPPPACAVSGDCAAPAAACAEARCDDGACFAPPRMGACDAAEYCDPERGCRPRPGVDAGIPPARDGGVPPVLGNITPPCVPSASAAPTAYDVLPQAPVTLPPAGGTYIDGATGMEVLRLTDETDGASARLAPHPRAGYDNDEVLVQIDGVLELFTFDVVSGNVLDQTLATEGLNCRPDSTGFSWLSPDLLCIEDSTTRIWRIDTRMPGPAGQAMERDLGTELPPGSTLERLVWDGDETLFAALVRDAGGAVTSVVAYDGLDNVYHHDYPLGAPSSLLMTGRGIEVVVVLSNRWELWNPRTDEVIEIWYSSGERASSCAHDTVWEHVVGFDCYEPGFTVRHLGYFPLVSLAFGALRHADGSPALDMAATVSAPSTNYAAVAIHTVDESAGGVASWDPWEQEVLLLSTDGSAMWRLAHHHSDVLAGGPDAAPRVSGDNGSWVAFDSFFDGVRYDVFLVRAGYPCGP